MVVICMRHSKLRYTLSMSVYEECSVVSLSVSGLPGHLASSADTQVWVRQRPLLNCGRSEGVGLFCRVIVVAIGW